MGAKCNEVAKATPYSRAMRFVKVAYLKKGGEVKRRVTYLTETPEFERYAGNQKECMRCGTTQQVKRCGVCRAARYCSEQCQLEDWPRHKWCCFPVDFEQDVLHLTVSTLGYDHLVNFRPATMMEGRNITAVLVKNLHH